MGSHSHVQRQSRMHQVLDPIPIPPHLPQQSIPHRLLRHDGRGGVVLVLGHRQRLRQLRPHRQVLGSIDQG